MPDSGIAVLGRGRCEVCGGKTAQVLCPKCRTKMGVLRKLGAELRFTSAAEGVVFVEDMSAGTAGSIVAAVLAKLIRSFGVEHAREIATKQFNNVAGFAETENDVS